MLPAVTRFLAMVHNLILASLVAYLLYSHDIISHMRQARLQSVRKKIKIRCTVRRNRIAQSWKGRRCTTVRWSIAAMGASTLWNYGTGSSEAWLSRPGLNLAAGTIYIPLTYIKYISFLCTRAVYIYPCVRALQPKIKGKAMCLRFAHSLGIRTAHGRLEQHCSLSPVWFFVNMTSMSLLYTVYLRIIYLLSFSHTLALSSGLYYKSKFIWD